MYSSKPYSLLNPATDEAEQLRWPNGGFVQNVGLCLSRGTLPFRLIGAHDALSARLGEEAGFDGIWASSLEISASHAVQDNGSLPRGELVERVREMAVAVRCPVMVDVDSGFGDVAETVEEFEAAGAAGVVIEDKRPPKFNSLCDAEHRLETIENFCDKLRRATSARASRKFAVVARLESLVAGQALEAMLERSEAYVEAGADALVIHSNCSDAADIIGALNRVRVPIPRGVIPTRFYRCYAQALREAGACFVIYANHGMRAKIRALREVFREIHASGSSESVEPRIASVEEVFDIQLPRRKD